MVEFKDKKEEKPTADVFHAEMEKLCDALDKEESVLQKINQSTDRTEDSVMLYVHVTESQKIIVALREQLALCQLYRERMKK